MKQFAYLIPLVTLATINFLSTNSYSEQIPKLLYKKTIYEQAMQNFTQNKTKIRAINIKIDHKKSSSNACFDRLKNTIFIDPIECSNIEQLEGTLLHELGHANELFAISPEGILITIANLSLHIIISFFAAETHNPQILISTLCFALFSTLITSWLVTINEERIADRFITKHCSSQKIALAMHKEFWENAQKESTLIKKKKQKILQAKTSFNKRISALVFLYKHYADAHPTAAMRAHFFKKEAKFIKKNRGKSLREYIEELLQKKTEQN